MQDEEVNPDNPRPPHGGPAPHPATDHGIPLIKVALVVSAVVIVVLLVIGLT